jgi:hypothetical protein
MTIVNGDICSAESGGVLEKSTYRLTEPILDAFFQKFAPYEGGDLRSHFQKNSIILISSPVFGCMRLPENEGRRMQ